MRPKPPNCPFAQGLYSLNHSSNADKLLLHDRLGLDFHVPSFDLSQRPKLRIQADQSRRNRKDNFERYGKEYAREWYQSVRKACKEQGREFLEYSVKEGWKPLCKFLDRDVPEAPFPRSDEVAQYRWKSGNES